MKENNEMILDVRDKPEVSKWFFLSFQHVWGNDFSAYFNRFSGFGGVICFGSWNDYLFLYNTIQSAGLFGK